MKKKFYITIFFIVFVLTACSSKPNFIEDSQGHKQYKDEEGNFIKNGWAEIKGNKYFFDMNGYLLTNEWAQNEYYVGDDGKMQINYWYKDNGNNYYYLGEDGKYVRNCIKKIDGHDYAFDENGIWIKNKIFINPDDAIHFMYADANGEIIKDKDFYNIEGLICNIDSSGFFVCNEWKEKDSKWYYFGSNGIMCVNSLINDEFAVDEEGVMIVNQKRAAINNMIYTFGNDGKAVKKDNGSFSSIVAKLNSKDTSRVAKIEDYCTVGVGNSYLEYSCAGLGRALDENGKKHIQWINDYFDLPSDLASKIASIQANGEIHTYENDMILLTYKLYTKKNSQYTYTEIKYTYKNLLNIAI